MRKISMSVFCLFGIVACGAGRSTPGNSVDGDGGSGGSGGVELNGGKSGDTNTGGTTNGEAARSCASGTMPDDTMNVAFSFLDAINYSTEVPPRNVSGRVIVERIENQALYLVDESGQRMSLRVSSKEPPFDHLTIGTQLWLTAFEQRKKNNPFSYHLWTRFSLRTEENGPVIFASLFGTDEGGETLLGVPLASQSLCSSTRASSFGGTSRETGQKCTETEELFEVVVSADERVSVFPGAKVEAVVQDKAYDVALWSASKVTFPDATCKPSDWEPPFALSLDVVARDWQNLLQNLSVSLDLLPECRLGTDQQPATFDGEGLDWEQLGEGNGEFSISQVVSAEDTVSFSVASLGTLVIRGISTEAHALIERGRWLSIIDYSNYVVRESEGGRPIAAVFDGALSTVSALTERPDMLGLSIATEPRCEWMSAACSDGNAVKSSNLYDVIYGDIDNHRVASHVGTSITVGTGEYDAWVGVNPSCRVDPWLKAVFVARTSSAVPE